MTKVSYYCPHNRFTLFKLQVILKSIKSNVNDETLYHIKTLKDIFGKDG